MAKQDCNVALIGTKFMGKAHSNAFLKVAKFFDLPVNPVMHTAVGRDPEATPAFANNWGWQHTSTDWEKTVADNDVHVVDVTTPNNTHAPMSIAALESGKMRAYGTDVWESDPPPPRSSLSFSIALSVAAPSGYFLKS